VGGQQQVARTRRAENMAINTNTHTHFLPHTLTQHTHTNLLAWTLQILPLSERQKSFRQNTAAYFGALPFE